MLDKLNGTARWIGVGLVVLTLIIGGVVYTHTQFVTIREHDADQHRIEKQLEEIHEDVKDLLRRSYGK